MYVQACGRDALRFTAFLASGTFVSPELWVAKIASDRGRIEDVFSRRRDENLLHSTRAGGSRRRGFVSLDHGSVRCLSYSRLSGNQRPNLAARGRVGSRGSPAADRNPGGLGRGSYLLS